MKKVIKKLKGKSKRQLLIIGGIALAVIIAIVVIICLTKSNKEATMKCKSLSNNMTIEFRGNKPVYVSGKVNLDGVEDIDKIEENIDVMSNVLILNKNNKTIRYGFSYTELNSSALNFVGLNYDKKMTYDKIKNNLENNNYYCK